MATEKRLIEVNAEIRKMKDVLAKMKTSEKSLAVEIIIAGLERAPTIDAVEVVRCKDCNWWLDGQCRNVFAMVSFDENNFCSYGERRAEDG